MTFKLIYYRAPVSAADVALLSCMHVLLPSRLHIVQWASIVFLAVRLSSSVGVCNTPRLNVTHEGQHAAGQ